jgi:hypothetical protein
MIIIPHGLPARHCRRSTFRGSAHERDSDSGTNLNLNLKAPTGTGTSPGVCDAGHFRRLGLGRSVPRPAPECRPVARPGTRPGSLIIIIIQRSVSRRPGPERALRAPQADAGGVTLVRRLICQCAH